MTVLYIILIILQIGVIVFFIRRSRIQDAKKKKATEGSVYETFRSQALSVTPDQLKLAIPNSETLVYGVVMDWDIGETVVTIAAYITGAASMYFSTGQGKSGGKSPEVGESAVDFVTSAQQYLDKTSVVSKPGTPEKGMVGFYLLTNQRIYMATEHISNFEQDASPWADLFQKGNDVIEKMNKAELAV